MKERFTRRDYRFIAVCAALTIASLALTSRYYQRAFPEASIRFEVTRDQSTPLAVGFLRDRGQSIEGFRHNAIFTYDNRAKTFLEKEMGLDQAQGTLGSRIRLWRFRHRWFRPLQKEEFRVDVTPAGEIVGYDHEIPEAAPGARWPADQARVAAQGFLSRVMGRDPGSLEFIQGKSEDRPARTDHTFTWQDPNFTFEESHHRFEVTIQGDQVGGYREYLQVPENWVRDYDRLRSRNLLAGQVDGLFFALLGVGMLVVFIRRIRLRDIKWKNALLFGSITAALNFLAALNSFPLIEADYDTTASYGGFVAEQLLQATFAAVASGAIILFLTAVGESLYRQNYRGHLALGHFFSWRGMRTRGFFLSAMLGLTLSAVFIAYQTGFYLIAQRLGAWSPAEVPYDDLLNTKIPWIFVLLGGFFPAVSEEFAFRMFSIPFLESLLKSRWAAVVLAGCIWGFGHATYPNQPFYVRGVEVGIAGVILGWVMIRYGIVATLIWHYTIDAVYSAILLVRSENTYLIVSGLLTALIVLIPMLAALVSYWKNGGFVPEEPLTNGAMGTCGEPSESPAPTIQAAPFTYQRLSGRTILTAAGIVGLLLLLYLIPAQRFGSFVKYDMTDAQARSAALDFVERERIADNRLRLSEFETAVFPVENYDSDVAEYVLKQGGLQRLNRFCSMEVRAALWGVRIFRPLEREEFTVALDPRTRTIVTYQHVVAQNAPGADLTAEEANARARAFLSHQGVDLSGFALHESSTEKRPARRDHLFVWEAISGSPLNIGEAKHRIRVAVMGAEIGQYRRELKLPESWVRTQEKTTALSTVLGFGPYLIMGALTAFTLFLFVNRARRGEIQWKPALRWAFGLALVSLAASLNDLPLRLQSYSTSVDLGVARVGWLTISAFIAIMAFMGSVVAAALMLSLYPQVRGLTRQTHRQAWRRDALVSLLLAAGAVFGLRQFHDLAQAKFQAAARFTDLRIPAGLGAWSTTLAQCSAIILATFLGLAFIGIVAHMIHRFFGKPSALFLAAAAAVGMMAAARSDSAFQFVFQWTMMLISLGAVLIYCRYILRNNLLAYVATFSGLLLLQHGYELVVQGAENLRYSGWFLLGLFAVEVAWLVKPLPRPRGQGHT